MCQDSFKGSALLSPSRNVGLGTSSAAGRVGSITSPFVIWLVCKRMIISYTQTSQQQLSVSFNAVKLSVVTYLITVTLSYHRLVSLIGLVPDNRAILPGSFPGWTNTRVLDI